MLGALPSALSRLGWHVTVVTPRYRGVADGTLVERIPVTVGALTFDVGYFEAPMADGARALLLDVPDLYDREALYNVGNVDYPDNARRFALLSRAALEWVAHHGERVSVIHGHDWQAGLTPCTCGRSTRIIPCSAGRRRSSRSTTSHTRDCSNPTGCLASICRGTCSRSTGWSTGAASAFSRPASTNRRW